MFIELGDMLVNIAEIAYIKPARGNEDYCLVGFKNNVNGFVLSISYQEALKIVKAALEPPKEAVEFGGLKDVKPE